MNNLMKWLEESFTPRATKLFNKPWIAAVASTMQKVIPFIMTGSVIYFYNVFKSYIPVLPDLSPIANFSFGIITVFITFMIVNQIMEKLNHPEFVINGGLAGIGVLFMVAIPFGEASDSISALLGNLGPAGMLVGIVIGMFVGLIFHLWAKLKFLNDSEIPDFVTNWINTICPTLLVLGITMVIVNVLQFDIYSFIVTIFSPLVNIAQTLPGFILMCFIPAFFYTLGISSWTFGAITTPIYLAAIQANIDAVAAGEAATNIVTSEAVFTLAFITLGGMCATLPLNVLMLFSKSKQLKTLGRIFIGPSVFNINEPVMFGAPVVFNPTLMLPAWICSIVGPIFVWIIMSTGLLNIPEKLINVGQVPAPISSVIVTEDMRAIIWYVVIFAIYTLIWYPFVKTYDKKLVEEEANQE